ncbi:hypothetical protein EV361DRAFT_874479, partial [Lentinula raphanica]
VVCTTRYSETAYAHASYKRDNVRYLEKGFTYALNSLVYNEPGIWMCDDDDARSRHWQALFSTECSEFLLALTLSISLHSLERFISFKQEKNPKDVLNAGCVGPALNVLSVLFVHDHGSHNHGHSDVNSITDAIELSDELMLVHASHHNTHLKPPKDHAPNLELLTRAPPYLWRRAVNNIRAIISAILVWKLKSPDRLSGVSLWNHMIQFSMCTQTETQSQSHFFANLDYYQLPSPGHFRPVNDTWGAEVEQRTKSMTVACVAMEEDRNSFLQLASETRKLLAQVVAFTKYAEHTLTESDDTIDVPLAKWMPRNAELLRRIILQLPGLADRMSEDPLLRKSLVHQVGGLFVIALELFSLIRPLEAAYSEGASRQKANPRKDNNSLFLLPKRQEMRRVLTAALELDCFLRHIPIAQPLSIPTAAHDALAQSVPAFDPPLLSDLHIDKKSIVPIEYEEEVPNVRSRKNMSALTNRVRQLFFQSSLEDLQSKFFSAKEQKLRTVLEAVQQFREDGVMIASKIAQVHENLRARLQHHQNFLDILNTSVENVIAQVDLSLNILVEKPSSEADKLDPPDDPLDFGQPHTSEYIEELWVIALRLLPLQGSRSRGYIKNQALDELRRF